MLYPVELRAHAMLATYIYQARGGSARAFGGRGGGDRRAGFFPAGAGCSRRCSRCCPRGASIAANDARDGAHATADGGAGRCACRAIMAIPPTGQADGVGSPRWGDGSCHLPLGADGCGFARAKRARFFGESRNSEKICDPLPQGLTAGGSVLVTVLRAKKPRAVQGWRARDFAAPPPDPLRGLGERAGWRSGRPRQALTSE